MYTASRRARLLSALALVPLAIVACKRQDPTPGPTPQTEQAAAASPISTEAKTAAAQVTGDYLRDQITTFSSDAFEGRGPATAGDTKARDYLVEQLKAIGFQPGGADGNWQQTVDVVSVKADLQKTWTFKSGNEAASFERWDEYIAGSGVQNPQSSIRHADVAFVGYGIQAPEYGWDDFKNQDRKGKVLLM